VQDGFPGPAFWKQHLALFLTAQLVCQSSIPESCIDASSASVVPEPAFSVPDAASQLSDIAIWISHVSPTAAGSSSSCAVA
jgi:hypothetical protein